MARRTIKCPRGERRFTVIQIERDPWNTVAARTIPAAMKLALPADPGSTIDVYGVCAETAEKAAYKVTHYGDGRKIRTFRAKRRG